MRTYKKCLVIIAAGLLALLSSMAQAEMVTITNAGFEDPDLSASPYYTPTIPGWTTESGLAGGVLASGMFSQGGYGGSNVAYSTIGATSGASLISQVIGTVTENTRYTMTVMVGDRDLPGSYDGNLPSTIYTQLDGLVPVSSTTPTPSNGGLATWTMVYDVLPGNASVGNDLKVLLGSDGAASSPVTQVLFDDVTLEATTIPEPTTAAMLAIGLLGLLAMRRKLS